MKHCISTITAILVSIVFFAACNKPSSPLALYVPADASVVFTIDAKSLTDKITASGISIDSLTRLVNHPMQAGSLNWNTLQNAGVYLDRPMYAFFKELNSMQQGFIKSSAFLAEVQDEGKLAAFLKNQEPDKTILKQGDYKYMALDDDYVAGWTKDVLIVAQVTGGNTAPGNYNTGQGTLSQQLLTNSFTQKKSASIAEAPGFEAMLAKPGDIHFYTASSPGMAVERIPAGAALQSLLKDSYTEGTISFENGKITASPVTHYGKALADIMGKYPTKQIDKAMLGSYPDTLTGFALVSFNPHIITDLLHQVGFDTMVDGFSSNLGFTSQDVMNAFSGDIALLFSKNAPVGVQPGGLGGAAYLLNFKIADRVLFDKIIKGLLDKQLLTKNGDEYQLGVSGGQGFVIQTAGNRLLIASSGALIKAYTSGSGKAVMPANIEKQVSDKSMAMYVDIAGLLQNANASSSGMHVTDSMEVFGASQLSKQTFKDMLITADKSDGHTARADAVLNFVDTDKNSLATLVLFFSAAKKEQLEREKRRMVVTPAAPGDENEND